jgi:hypothetical protein
MTGRADRRIHAYCALARCASAASRDPSRWGERVELLDAPASYEPHALTVGERGVVEFVDSLCSTHFGGKAASRSVSSKSTLA